MSVFSSEVIVDNTVLVDGSAVTQPVSAASLPLPSGAATNAAVLALTKPSDVQLVDGSAHVQPVSGTFWPGTQPVSGSVSVSGTVNTLPAVSNSATLSQVNVTTTNVMLLAANANRKKAIIFSAGTTVIKLGAVATATSWSYKLTAGAVLELSGWTGQIDAIQLTGTSVLNITELV